MLFPGFGLEPQSSHLTLVSRLTLSNAKVGWGEKEIHIKTHD